MKFEGKVYPSESCCGAGEFYGSFESPERIRKLCVDSGKTVIFFAKNAEGEYKGQVAKFEKAGFKTVATFKGQYGNYNMHLMVFERPGHEVKLYQPEVKHEPAVSGSEAGQHGTKHPANVNGKLENKHPPVQVGLRLQDRKRSAKRKPSGANKTARKVQTIRRKTPARGLARR